MRVVVAVWMLAACGRIGFDATTGDGGAPDMLADDAPPNGAPFTIDLPVPSAIIDVAVMLDGGVVAVGARIGSLTLDGITDPGLGAIDAVVLALDANGRARWIHQWGGTENDVANAVAVAPDGSIYVGGFVENTATLGGVSRVNQGRDAFLAKYTADGDYVWNVGFGGVEDAAEHSDFVYDIAIAPNGDVVIVGQVAGDVDFGGGMTPASSATTDAFIARYSSTGQYIWARRFGDTDTNGFAGVEATNDAIYIGGFYSGTPNFGGGPLPARGGNDAIMARFTSDGATVMWMSNFGGPDNQRIYDVALINGALVGAGYYWETVDLPGIPASSGRADGLVVTFGNPGGFLDGAVRYGGANCDFLFSAHVGGGDVIASGTFSDTIALDTPVTAAGNADSIAFAVTNDSFTWHRTLGNDTDEVNQGAAGSLATGLYLGGSRDVQLDAGCYAITGMTSGYIRRF